MSYKNHAWFTGAMALHGYDATPAVAASVDHVGDPTQGSFAGFLVGTVGDAPVPEVIVYMLDGSYLTFKAIQAGVPYAIPNRGVHAVSSNMTDVWALKG